MAVVIFFFTLVGNRVVSVDMTTIMYYYNTPLTLRRHYFLAACCILFAGWLINFYWPSQQVWYSCDSKMTIKLHWATCTNQEVSGMLYLKFSPASYLMKETYSRPLFSWSEIRALRWRSELKRAQENNRQNKVALSSNCPSVLYQERSILSATVPLYCVRINAFLTWNLKLSSNGWFLCDSAVYDLWAVVLVAFSFTI